MLDTAGKRRIRCSLCIVNQYLCKEGTENIYIYISITMKKISGRMHRKLIACIASGEGN